MAFYLETGPLTTLVRLHGGEKETACLSVISPNPVDLIHSRGIIGCVYNILLTKI